MEVSLSFQNLSIPPVFEFKDRVPDTTFLGPFARRKETVVSKSLSVCRYLHGGRKPLLVRAYLCVDIAQCQLNDTSR
jgi:hypothetical protein